MDSSSIGNEFTAKILDLNEPNKNGRTYTSQVADQIIRVAEQREDKGQVMYGEFNPEPNLSIDLSRVSHMVSNLRFEGDCLVGTIRLMTTPMGNIAKELLSNVNGLPNAPAFRPRGTAVVDANGVVSDYNIVSIDLVSNPA